MKHLLLALIAILLAAPASAEFSHRYQAVEGFNHHIYLEGYEFPIMNAGPMDPAPSPDGSQIAFSARGWIWVMDLDSGQARRITHTGAVDSRPEWSPDGSEIVFNRDYGRKLAIVTVSPGSGRERIIVDDGSINLDPVYSPDNSFIYYSSAKGGHFNLWRAELDSLAAEQVTASGEVQRRLLKRRPQILGDGQEVLYIRKQNTRDSIEIIDTRTQESSTLVVDRLSSQTDLSVSPDGRYLAYTWPFDGGHELRLMALAEPDTSVLLTRSLGLPLAPAFGHDGKWIYFSEASDRHRNELKRISANGGRVESGLINDWDWGEATGTLIINTTRDGNPAAARLSVVQESGHPLIPNTGVVRSDLQSDRVFFYSEGEVRLEVPAGKVTVTVVQGFETPEQSHTIQVQARETIRTSIEMQAIWDASASGWYAADNHFHLNYGGNYRLLPEDIVPDLKGEGVDVAFPLLANLHNRFLQQELWGWSRTEHPFIFFGQEIRSHFLGHVEQIGSDELFWPWVWGPSYQLYASDDRLNAEALRHARAHGGLGGYVHPVPVHDPFSPDAPNTVPIGFVADAVLGEIDIIEVACLYTSEIGTAAVWHAVLNLGIPLAASAGSDVMNDYYRTMAIGGTRVYVKPEGDLNEESFLAALKRGRSFVSTGPLLEFRVEGAEPGEAFDPGSGRISWTADVHSAMPYARLEIFVNGIPVKSFDGNDSAGSKSYSGEIEVPAGGWVTARVTGPYAGWPAMNSDLYAESSPIWIGEVGSLNPEDARRSARQLLEILDQSKTRMVEGYGDAEIPRLLAHFERARKRLTALAE
jgi:TolB protein